MKNLYFCFLFIVVFVTRSLFVQGQCGVTAVIHGFTSNNQITLKDSSNFNPGWSPYKYEWKINDLLVSNSMVTLANNMPDGCNKVCLTVFATNSSTGDSCFDTRCNIFSGTFSNLDYNIKVQPNATDSIGIDYWITPVGGTSAGPVPINIDFGDGSTLSTYTGSGNHHYPSAGNYLFLVSNGIINQSSVKVHVNNGIPNINLPSSPSIFSNCDSVNLTLFCSTPVSNSLATYYYDHNTDTTQLITVNQNFTYRYHVPGVTKIMFTLIDNAGSTLRYVNYSFIDDCNTVPDTITGFVWHDTDADGIKDSTELPVINQGITMHNYSAFTDSNGYYSLLLPDRDIDFYPKNVPRAAVTNPVGGTYSTHLHTGSSHSGFDFGIASLDVQICGKTFVDYNADSVFTFNTDEPLKYITIRAFNSVLNKYYYTTTDAQGNYCLNLPGGNFTVNAVLVSIDSAYSVPDTFQINSMSGNFYRDFAINSYLPGCNPQLMLFGNDRPRPGFPFSVSVIVRNSGIDNSRSTVVLYYDSSLIVTNPGGGILNTNQHMVTWNNVILPASGDTVVGIQCMIPQSIPLGTVLSCNANVSPVNCTDHDLSNNATMVDFLVVGAFDPNDKSVFPSGVGSSGEVHHDQLLHYHINFQNTGTAEAINVYVQDVIDANLDLNTFSMETASHPFTLVSNDRVLTWKFMNINLPDSNSNEPASHGYLDYSILPVQGLPDGSQIHNSAAIYFDFNSPVKTNDVLNTLQSIITFEAKTESEKDFLVYPQPFSNSLTIVLPEKVHDAEIHLLDPTGKLVLNQLFNNGTNEITIDTQKLLPGIYLLTVNGLGFEYRKCLVRN